jgi:transposase-like protein
MILASRQLMPLEVKQEALRKILAGESQASVARDLDLPVSTVSTWWRKKDLLLPAETAEKNIEFLDQTVQELESAFAEAVRPVSSDTVATVDCEVPVLPASQPGNEEQPQSCGPPDVEPTSVSSFTEPASVKAINLPCRKQELLKSMKSAFIGKAAPPEPENRLSPSTAATCSGPKKKKSLELLANSLLQKALAQQQAGEMDSNTSNGGLSAGETTVACASGFRTNGSGPGTGAATRAAHGGAPSLGLCMIADSYVSSEDEES